MPVIILSQGHTLKSSITHVVEGDGRDSKSLPTRGKYWKLYPVYVYIYIYICIYIYRYIYIYIHIYGM